MTIEEARAAVGRLVIYRPPGWHGCAPAEEGVVTSVNERYVFVRYGSQQTPAATLPDDLTLSCG